MTEQNQIAEMADRFEEFRARLREIARLHLPKTLARRFSPEDLLQETWMAAVRRREDYFAHAELPPFIRFRALLLQTLVDLERKHLLCQKRDARQELEFDAEGAAGGGESREDRWNLLANTLTSPRTKLAREEQRQLVVRLLKELPATDREIIEMRNFETLSNTECAAALGIAEKTASIRYVRALKRFREILMNTTGFGDGID